MVPGADEALAKFRRLGKTMLFVTNNSSKSREMAVQKALGFGMDVRVDDMVTSGYMAAEYLRAQDFTKKAFVIGSVGVEDELRQVYASSSFPSFLILERL